MFKKIVLMVFAVGIMHCLSGIAQANFVTLFSDNFNDNSLDTAKWTLLDKGGSSFYETNGSAQFTIYGSPDFNTNSIAIKSQTINAANNWTSVKFDTQWLIPYPVTAEYNFSVISGANSLKVAYSSWPYSQISIYDNADLIWRDTRPTPKTMTPVSFNINRTGQLELWENGVCVKALTDPKFSLMNSNSFQVQLGGWDYSGYPNQTEYFDSVSFSANTPVPEPATMSLLGIGILGLIGLRKSYLSK